MRIAPRYVDTSDSSVSKGIGKQLESVAKSSLGLGSFDCDFLICQQKSSITRPRVLLATCCDKRSPARHVDLE